MFAEYGVLNYWTYLVGAIFIVLVPGPNTLFVLKNSVSSGMKGGYLAACGVFIGDAVVMFLAWAGVATLIKTLDIQHCTLSWCCTTLLYLGSKILYATLKGKNNRPNPMSPNTGPFLNNALILSLTNRKPFCSMCRFRTVYRC
ncbi:LysE family transporter [Escherichia coli]|nr:LysE family transporter [Escherichia coli]